MARYAFRSAPRGDEVGQADGVALVGAEGVVDGGVVVVAEQGQGLVVEVGVEEGLGLGGFGWH